jgi:RimJ/RimL family protein N-acetyltransferase
VSTVAIRPLERGDRASLLEIFAGMGPRSRQRRFLTAKSRLTEQDLHGLTDVDQRDHIALVAISASSGRPIGVGRFVREQEDRTSADVALAVVDAWQNRGVGTLLARELSSRALALGLRQFTLAMHPDNRPVQRLLHRAPGLVTALSEDPHTLELSITLMADQG